MNNEIIDILIPNKLIGGNIDSKTNQQKLLDIIDKSNLKDEYKKLINLSKDQLIKLIEKQNEEIKDKDKIIEIKSKKERIKKSIDDYNLINYYKFLRTEDGKIYKNNENDFYKYDEFETAFDRNLRTGDVKFRDYQKKFIEDWSVSQQELVILYYGVGTGKTLIAVNCAEQFVEITNSRVYFLLPSSLILNTILEFYTKGIDPSRKNKDGNFIYNFISYQQLLISEFDFEDQALLIVDEIHNLRNVRSQEISEKVSARKWVPTDSFSLVGNKLSQQLIINSNKFIRKIFLTGTLFVNSPDDIEPIIAIGYNKEPQLNFNRDSYEVMTKIDDTFKTYFQGLISYYKIEGENKKMMPTVKYEFIPLEFGKKKNTLLNKSKEEDAFYISSRNEPNDAKCDYIIDYILENKDKKILIYSQFLDRSFKYLMAEFKKKDITFGFISGALNQVEKLNVVSDYNTDKIKILLFTLSIKEGISFKETNDIFIIQPYWNYSILEQILARGIRLNSHKKGYKSVVNCKFLVGLNEDTKDAKDVIKEYNRIMNNDIKKLEYKLSIVDNRVVGIYDLQLTFGNRDLQLYNMMFNKQEAINVFEKRLLALPRFEDVNNIENNEFIKYYNNEILELEKEKTVSLIEKIKLKKKLYNEFYNKQIIETNKRIIRFNNNTKFKSNRNPNLQEIADSTKSEDKTKQIEELINNNTPLDKIFEVFNITKQDIVKFQANFTPTNHIELIIEQSGIKNNNNSNIKILEPTAGIGGIIGELLKLNNNYNFNIDANELYNIFYQIGSTIYNNIDNVKWYNNDFMKYEQRYNYNYILGNPPFNLRTRKNGVDITLYDIDFVERSYNMLVDEGVLSFIISDRFQRDKASRFEIFNNNLDLIKDYNEGYVKIIKLESGFKSDSGVSKTQETNFGMVCITLQKVPNFIFTNKELRSLIKKELKSIKTGEPIKIKKEKIIKEKKEKIIKKKLPKKPIKK
jgi:superfamily II DNA or RNA helicase